MVFMIVFQLKEDGMNFAFKSINRSKQLITLTKNGGINGN